jgi:hypothetical protein
VTGSLRRRRKSAWPVAVAVGVPLLVVAAVAIGMSIPWGPPPAPPAARAEDFVLQKAHELVAQGLAGGSRAEYAHSGYTVTNHGGGKWTVKSYLDVPGILGTTRRHFEAELEQKGRDVQVVALEVDGKPFDLARGDWVGVSPPTTNTTTSDTPSGENGAPAISSPSEMTIAVALERLATEIRESARQRMTTVVWLVDRTQSAELWRADVTSTFAPIEQELSRGEKNLKMSVAGYAGKNVTFVTDEPTADAAAIRQALETVQPTEQGGENTLAALAEAARKLGPLGRDQGGYLIFVVVTEEAGDDAAKADEVIPALKRCGAIVNVIGVEAPLGRAQWANAPMFGEQPLEGADVVVQGPESPHGERIDLGFWNVGYADVSDALGSGFGPYALARVCFETEGTFFACRDGRRGLAGWGTKGMTIDARFRRKYAPPYMPAAQYEAEVASNRAVQGLRKAAEHPRVEVAKTLMYEFVAGDEAALKRALDSAQRDVARLEPKLAELYDALKPGEADRAKLTVPRLQAAYDLAMGRVLAARVRVEGYNAMLAQLKQGKRFTKEGSTTWVIHETNTISAGSAYERLLKDAAMYLERVKKEHPGTPWAYLADQELASPMGWEWQER